MMFIRGNNVFPSSIEAVIREIAEVAEFQIELRTNRAMQELCVAIEPSPAAVREVEALVEKVRSALRQRLGFVIDVRAVSEGVLPRFELKSRRVVRITE